MIVDKAMKKPTGNMSKPVDDRGRPWPSKFNMQAANEHYKMKRDDSFELALHLPGDEVAFNLSSLTSD